MGNLFDYIHTNGSRSLSELPFTDVDNLLFSYLVYYDFRGIVPAPKEHASVTVKEAAMLYSRKHGQSQRNVDSRLLSSMAGAARFQDVKLSDFTDVYRERTTQFAALKITMEDTIEYLSFRGVDNTLTGWHEAFRGSYRVTAAQRMAAEWFRRVGQPEDDGRALILGGHSKGGNLAMYAAAQAPEEMQQKISTIFSNDGLELMPGFYDREGYLRIKDRIRRIVPQFSIVSWLIARQKPDLVISCSVDGLMQHEPLYWATEGTAFAKAPGPSKESARLGATLGRWIRTTPEAERESFTEDVFRALKKEEELPEEMFIEPGSEDDTPDSRQPGPNSPDMAPEPDKNSGSSADEARESSESEKKKVDKTYILKEVFLGYLHAADGSRRTMRRLIRLALQILWKPNHRHL